MNFKKGDEVVSIVNWQNGGGDQPKKGVVYIVEFVVTLRGQVGLQLKGMNHDTKNDGCLGYCADYFRKLADVELQQELAQQAIKHVEQEKIDVPLKEEELC